MLDASLTRGYFHELPARGHSFSPDAVDTRGAPFFENADAETAFALRP